MKEQNSGLMEEGIITEDGNLQITTPDDEKNNKPSNFALKPKHTVKKTQNLFSKITKPKIIILIICLITIVIISLMFLLLDKKPKAQTIIDPSIVIASPEIQNNNKTIDPEIQKGLDAFSTKIEKLKGVQIDFSPPIIDFKSLSSF